MRGGRWTGWTRWRRAALRAAVLLVATLAGVSGGVPAGARPGQLAQTLQITTGHGATVVQADGCNWPEGEAFGPGSSVSLTVTTWFAGPGQASTPRVIAKADVVPPVGGGWQYQVPRPPLAQVPAWATEVVTRATASCHQAIGSGFAYEPTEVRRAIDRPAVAPTATTTPANGTGTQATPAAPVSGTATFTG